MTRNLCAAIGTGALLVAISAAGPVSAQKQGGVLRMYSPDSPASMSILEQVTTNGDYEVTCHLKQRQPALLTTLAAGYAPVYPCHVPARDMRSHPIGTGPFKFVEFKPNEYIKVTRNADYWKPDRPYLD